MSHHDRVLSGEALAFRDLMEGNLEGYPYDLERARDHEERMQVYPTTSLSVCPMPEEVFITRPVLDEQQEHTARWGIESLGAVGLRVGVVEGDGNIHTSFHIRAGRIWQRQFVGYPNREKLKVDYMKKQQAELAAWGGRDTGPTIREIADEANNESPFSKALSKARRLRKLEAVHFGQPIDKSTIPELFEWIEKAELLPN